MGIPPPHTHRIASASGNSVSVRYRVPRAKVPDISPRLGTQLTPRGTQPLPPGVLLRGCAAAQDGGSSHQALASRGLLERGQAWGH